MEPIFGSAFAAPAAFWDPEAEHQVLTEPTLIGQLELPTGRPAIHDPGYEFAPEALDRGAAPGTYPVDLALRSWVADDGTMTPAALTAAVRVSFQANAARRFVPVRSSDGARELSFGVDSGLISVFDRSLLKWLAGTAILDTLPESVPESAPGRPSAQIVTSPAGSIFVCQAGMGDGGYRAWWGLDIKDEATELIVDFGLLEYSRWRTVEFPASALLGSSARLRLAVAGTGLEVEPVSIESIGIPAAPWTPERPIALRRPAGPSWEFRLFDGEGTLVGSPGHAQLVPGPWFEIFDAALVERAETVRVRIHEGTAPLELHEA